MTQDEIIEMTRQAANAIPGYTAKVKDPSGSVLEFYKRFAALVASAEREACAKVCDVIAQKMDDEGEGPTGNICWVIDCAEAIRARGQA